MSTSPFSFIKYNNKNVSNSLSNVSNFHFFLYVFLGSPFKLYVDSIPSGYVTAYGPGLISGVSGEPCLFTISTKGAGAGKL